MVGSTALLGYGNDVDYAVLVPNAIDRLEAAAALLEVGYKPDGSLHVGPGSDDFASLSKIIDGKKVNYLLCGATSWQRYTRGHAACAGLMAMGVAMDVKALRVFVHQIVGGASVEHAMSEAGKYK